MRTIVWAFVVSLIALSPGTAHAGYWSWGDPEWQSHGTVSGTQGGEPYEYETGGCSAWVGVGNGSAHFSATDYLNAEWIPRPGATLGEDPPQPQCLVFPYRLYLAGGGGSTYANPPTTGSVSGSLTLTSGEESWPLTHNFDNTEGGPNEGSYYPPEDQIYANVAFEMKEATAHLTVTCEADLAASEAATILLIVARENPHHHSEDAWHQYPELDSFHNFNTAITPRGKWQGMPSTNYAVMHWYEHGDSKSGKIIAGGGAAGPLKDQPKNWTGQPIPCTSGGQWFSYAELLRILGVGRVESVRPPSQIRFNVRYF